MFCATVLGSDKTTMSVAMGQTEYYPVYISNGLIHNNVRRAHRNSVTLLAFLAIPKSSSWSSISHDTITDNAYLLTADREHKDSEEFRKFQRSLFHTSLNQILQPLRPYMEKPEVVRYRDGHYHRTIYGLGPYIADYPEQVLLACIVQGWCPRCVNFTFSLMINSHFKFI